MEKKKFDGILICSDIDGTIFYQFPGMEKGYVPENVCRAIKYFQNNGGRFTLATGRFPKYAGRALSQYITPNAPLITLNGAVIYDADTDTELFSCPINDDIARLSYDVIAKYPNMWRVDLQCADGCSYTLKPAQGGGYKYRNASMVADRYRDIHSREEFVEFSSGLVVHKILYVFPAEDSEVACAEIAASFPEYAISRSWINGVELQSADADKGKSSRRLADLLGDVRLLICAGDYENDISMLKEADIGYAVADAVDKAKKAADRVTVRTCFEGAMEEIIEDLEKEFG